MTEAMAGSAIVGLVLAGGLSRRMGGGDKWARALGGRPLLAHVLARAEGQVRKIAINANGDPARLAAFGRIVLPDVVPGFAGPLAGVLTGLEWAAEAFPDCSHLATFACDAPFFPRDLVARLETAAQEAGTPLACAASRGRHHPVFGLWPLALRHDLRRAVIEEGLRKVDIWTARHGLAAADFPDLSLGEERLDPFFNANRQEDLAEAERYLGLLEAA